MEVFFWKTNHNVYNSLLNVFSSFDVKRYDTKVLIKTPTIHIEDSSVKIKNRPIYITKSPLMSLFTWKLRFKGAKAFIFEEYFRKTPLKDSIVKDVLKTFKEYPFITMTKRTREFLESNGHEVFYIPPAERKREYNFKRKYILMVSRLIDSKNIRLFLKLSREFPRERFLLIGKGPLEIYVRRIATKQANLSFIKFVKNREDLFKFYSSSKLLIHPPLKDPIGFVVVEALSCSTPVLSSLPTGSSDFLPKRWRVKSFDLNEWKKKLNYVLQNNEKEIKRAEKVFSKEKLNINSPYFKKLGKKISLYIKERWGEN